MTTSRSPFDALKPAAGRMLETALNRALALDEDTRAGLSALDGQRLQLHLEAPPLAMEIAVQGTALRVGPVQGDEADLSVRAGLGALLGQLPMFRSSGTPVGRVNITGDAELARRLQRLAEGFDPDWALPFSAVLGPVIGPQVAKGLREALRGAQVQASNVARSAADFLTEESGDVVAKAEQHDFFDQVDAVRDRVERLAARVAQRAARSDSAQGPSE